MSPSYPVQMAFITFVFPASKLPENVLPSIATVCYYIDLNKQKDLSNKVRNREIGQS